MPLCGTGPDARRLMKSEFKLLCNTQHACPEVKRVLEGLGFTSLRDLDGSPSFDMSAKLDVRDRRRAEEIAGKIFETCGRKVQAIAIAVKG